MEFNREITLLDVEEEDLDEIYVQNERVFKDDCIQRDWFDDLIGNTLIFQKIILNSTNQIIGSIAITRDPRQRDREMTYLWVFYILPEFQRKGLGSYILQQALEIIKQGEFTYMQVNTKDYNEPAINLYKKFSFRIIKHIPKYYRSGDNAVLMRLLF